VIEIRRMELKDIPEVVEIDRSSFTLPWTERSFKYEVQENRAARCWVTTVDERVVAMLVVWMIVDEAHIATIATHPHFRRRGFAKRMLVKALVMAREEGAQKALLEVRIRHAVAQKIYCDIGFVEVGRRPMYYRDNGEDAVLMTLENLGALEYAEVE
jgi:[ribosomal protein S18]-alanine N-acetyltransferase